ncbi:hypothetical protein B0H15DRAFT_832054 [Mycena belliarum]|uniref:Uncharacterized protein n=1 Tax=Mycena belliarum TaxID=1033014 RepID=A0AAD6U6Y9_9AGAR|nr:hypothetical protein B0H15DRAFT_832054 [Mycena belliae]
MPVFPQELLDAIVGKLDENPALKSCSLAASSLRVPCQRILLRSLTLSPGWAQWAPGGSIKDCVAAATLLAESPHISRYITRLTIELHETQIVDVDDKALLKVLSNLDNVHQCIVTRTEDVLEWDELSPGISSALVYFLFRQPLRELHVHFISAIPEITFLQLVAAAPLVSFLFVIIETSDHSSESLLLPPTVENLIFESDSEDACTVLARSQWAACIAAVRRLSIPPHYPAAENLIQATSRTLQHLRLRCTEPLETPTLSLPCLPALCSIELAVFWDDPAILWFLTVLSPLLAPGSSPALAELTITLFPIGRLRYKVLYALTAGLLTALDDALAAHPAAPRMRWRLDLSGDHSEAHFADFSQKMQRGMPVAHRAGRLEFEAYDEKSEYADGLSYAIQR